MNTLLVALGILVCFGVLFWLDRYYKDSGDKKDTEQLNPPDSGGDDPGSDSEAV